VRVTQGVPRGNLPCRCAVHHYGRDGRPWVEPSLQMKGQMLALILGNFPVERGKGGRRIGCAMDLVSESHGTTARTQRPERRADKILE